MFSSTERVHFPLISFFYPIGLKTHYEAGFFRAFKKRPSLQRAYSSLIFTVIRVSFCNLQLFFHHSGLCGIVTGFFPLVLLLFEKVGAIGD